MSLKLSKILKTNPKASAVGSGLHEYEGRYRSAQQGGMASKSKASKEFTDLYYDLVTDFFEYGWGRSFHFAPRVPGESFRESLVRHEHFLSEALELKPGMVVADFGCGIGGSIIGDRTVFGRQNNRGEHQFISIGTRREVCGRSGNVGNGRFSQLRFPACRRSRCIV